MPDTPSASDPLAISCDYYYYKPMAAFFNAFHLRAYREAGLRLEEPVLDVGCSNGTFGVVLERTVGPMPLMTGIDLSPSGIERARRVASHCYKELIIGDAARLPFDSGSFRTVISNASMVSFGSGVEQAVGEMHRVLQPGGRVYATLATRLFEENYLFPGIFRALGLHRLADYSTRSINRRLPHFYAFSADDWKHLFERQGFHVDRMFGFFPLEEVKMWGFLAWTPLRAHALLSCIPGDRVRKSVARFYRNIFASRYARYPAELDPHGSPYIFLSASKR